MTTAAEERLARTRAAMLGVMEKAVNVSDAERLAAQLAWGVATRSPTVSEHDAALVKAIVQAVAPHLKELQDEVAELRERIGELES